MFTKRVLVRLGDNSPNVSQLWKAVRVRVGTGNNQRIGNAIRIHKLRFNCRFTPTLTESKLVRACFRVLYFPDELTLPDFTLPTSLIYGGPSENGVFQANVFGDLTDPYVDSAVELVRKDFVISPQLVGSQVLGDIGFEELDCDLEQVYAGDGSCVRGNLYLVIHLEKVGAAISVDQVSYLDVFFTDSN